MKKYFSRPLIASLAILATLIVCIVGISSNKSNQKVSFDTDIASDSLNKESKELGNYVLLMMSIVRSDLSDAKKMSIARNIVNISNDIFDNFEQRKQFVILIAIESRFNSDAKSPAGAVGLTQVMPQYAKEFAKPCGIPDFTTGDLVDTNINLLLGACRFKTLMAMFDGQPVPALVAYNAGLASNQLKQLESLGSISNTETASYVVKWAYIKDKIDLKVKSSKETKSVKDNRPEQGKTTENN